MRRVCQNFQDVLCHRCAEGYYPLIGLCLKCPEVGLTAQNLGNVVLIYGGVCLLWLLLNRYIAENSAFMDSICNFCQVVGTLQNFQLKWPGASLSTSCTRILCTIASVKRLGYRLIGAESNSGRRRFFEPHDRAVGRFGLANLLGISFTRDIPFVRRNLGL